CKITMISQLLGFVPLSILYYGLFYLFVVFHVSNAIVPLFGYEMRWSQVVLEAMPIINFIAVIWLIPNFIRSFSLQFVSSNMHYYGDIDPRDVITQTQVLTPWWMMPFQLFSCNFSAPHAIHHSVLKEALYTRPMTSKTAPKVMKEAAGQLNDLSTLKRLNRWKDIPTK